MKISYKWLKEFVNTDLSPNEMAEKLTMAGIEVSAVESLDKGIKKVIAAEVRSVNPHPNADNLTYCYVFNGKEEIPIVCGAKNVKTGDKVPLAIVGAILPGGREISEVEIRGKKSFGMMCSEKELGLSEDHGGIMILPAEVICGQDINKILDLDDFLLEVEPTPNRGDALSVLGVARELAAVLNIGVKLPQPKLKETVPGVEKFIKVKIKESKLCPRYTARYLSNVVVKSSPLWIQNRLRNCGLRPINNVVDITNYVLLELGHPLHAFDATALQEQKIVVRCAKEDEKIVTLDGISRKLNKNMLVIADGRKPVAVAGIMGGGYSSVKENTETVVLESAYFNPVTIRRTAREFGLVTEASYRFERGTDLEILTLALDRIAQLIQDLAGAQVAKGIYDAYPNRLKPSRISLRQERVNKILGLKIPFVQTKKILKNLGFGIKEGTRKETLNVVVPTWRNDITREIDLIEEIARLNDYQKIPLTLPKGAVVRTPDNISWQNSEEIRKILTGCGLTEVLNYGFIGVKDFQQAEIAFDPQDKNLISLQNPLTEEQRYLRPNLICGLLSCLQYNINHGNADLNIFEIGNVFLGRGQKTYANEVKKIAFALTGKRATGSWQDQETQTNFFDLKGVVETLLDKLKVSDYNFTLGKNPTFHPIVCQQIIVQQKPVGIMGQISHQVLENYGLKQDIFMAELDLKLLLQTQIKESLYKPIPKFPAIKRDIALLVPGDISHQEVLRTIRKGASDLVKGIELFDVYQTDKIDTQNKSLAYHLVYQSEERTLQDEEVNKLHQALAQYLEEKLKVKIR